jgi:hypothetical protein
LDFLKANAEGQKLQDCLQILDLMSQISVKEPKMWGSSIVGFGSYHYKYASGMEGDWMVLGFSPRKANITLYIMPGFGDYNDKNSKQSEIMGSLGKFKTGKSCLYIKKLADINLEILTELIQKSLVYMKEKYETDL